MKTNIIGITVLTLAMGLSFFAGKHSNKLGGTERSRNGDVWKRVYQNSDGQYLVKATSRMGYNGVVRYSAKDIEVWVLSAKGKEDTHYMNQDASVVELK